MAELLDGLLWCNDCGMPMLSDGKGNYAHINQLEVSRISELIQVPFIAGSLADWFINLETYCSHCDEAHHPFTIITKPEFIARCSTKVGADDVAGTIKSLFQETQSRDIERR